MAGSAWISDYKPENEGAIARRTLDLARDNLELQFEIAHRLRVEEELRAAKANLENIFNNVIPICVTSLDFEILQANHAYRAIFGEAVMLHSRLKCYESRPGSACHTAKCPVEQIKQGIGEAVLDVTKDDGKGGQRHYIITARPFLNASGQLVGIVETFQDITIRKRFEEEKARLIIELKAAQAQVKTLSGFLPICSSCKKIRDDNGYWRQIDAYMREHANIDFSHGICPECARRYYPGYNLYEPEDR